MHFFTFETVDRFYIFVTLSLYIYIYKDKDIDKYDYMIFNNIQGRINTIYA